jgi:ABC-type transporter Mla MlaB component
METQHEKLSTAKIRIDLAGDFDESMSEHVSDTLEAMMKNSLVTISLRHIRKTCWGAVCAFANTVRESRKKGIYIRVTDAQPRVALLLHASGLPFA